MLGHFDHPMKNRIIFVLAAAVAMIVEWQYIAFRTENVTVRHYHGLCNVGVGQPYADFIHQLHLMSESGDTNKLASVLRRADEHSRDIYDVWLADKRDAYQKSIDEILK